MRMRKIEGAFAAVLAALLVVSTTSAAASTKTVRVNIQSFANARITVISGGRTSSFYLAVGQKRSEIVSRSRTISYSVSLCGPSRQVSRQKIVAARVSVISLQIAPNCSVNYTEF